MLMVSSGSVVLAAALVLSGCTAGALETAAPSATGAPPSATDPDPSECPLERTGDVVVAFVEAVETGDPAVVDRFISDDRFAWYSVNGPTGRRVDPEARNRSTLAAYLAERHEQAERYELAELAVTVDRTTDLAHLSLTLSHHADDLPDGPQLVSAKGALDCASGKIVAWSIGGVASEPVDLCPDRGGEEPTICVSADAASAR